MPKVFWEVTLEAEPSGKKTYKIKPSRITKQINKQTTNSGCWESVPRVSKIYSLKYPVFNKKKLRYECKQESVSHAEEKEQRLKVYFWGGFN